MSRLDPLLKTLQVRASPPEGLVQAYLIHIADGLDTNFKKILEIKGITAKRDQASLVELFHAHRAAYDNLASQSPLLTPLNLSQTGGPVSALGAATGAISTPGLGLGGGGSGRFDPAMFGSALMSAARDGVDRLGTPSLAGAKAEGERRESLAAGSPPPNALQQGMEGAFEGNLRNIGKFFKRDISGSGFRFGVGGNKE
jgi:vacuolar protein sorting-associated protein 53